MKGLLVPSLIGALGGIIIVLPFVLTQKPAHLPEAEYTRNRLLKDAEGCAFLVSRERERLDYVKLIYLKEASAPSCTFVKVEK